MATTRKELDRLVELINEKTGSPKTSWERLENGTLKAKVDNFHISGAYGGVCLHRMVTDGGGVMSYFGGGFVSKRELADKMRAFLDGLNFNG